MHLGKIHPSLTLERVTEATQREMTTLDNPGFCIKCGEEQDGCEPDAEQYTCENCNKRAVYGAAQLLLYMI